MELLGIRTLLTRLQCETLGRIRSPRNLQFGAFFLVTLFVFRGPLHDLIVFSLSSDLFFYILLIPFVSAYFVYVRKEKTFANLAYSFPVGSLIILAGFILYFLGKEWRPRLTQNAYLAVMTVSALVTWIGGFIFSSLYLFITSLVFGQLFLSTPVKRAVLTFSVLPITIFKNGLRIATLALLGNYVDEAILSSNAHRRGGIPFMIVAVVLLAVVVRLLRKTEERSSSSRELRIVRQIPDIGR